MWDGWKRLKKQRLGLVLAILAVAGTSPGAMAFVGPSSAPDALPNPSQVSLLPPTPPGSLAGPSFLASDLSTSSEAKTAGWGGRAPVAAASAFAPEKVFPIRPSPMFQLPPKASVLNRIPLRSHAPPSIG